MSGLEVRIEQITRDHLLPYAVLSRTEYGDSAVANIEHLRWKFLENPQGPSVGVHLYSSGGELVGRFAAQPRDFQGPHGSVHAAYLTDLLVDRRYRGIGALSLLVGSLDRLARWFDLVIVTPNAAGLPIWRDFARLPISVDLSLAVVPVRLTGAMTPAARTPSVLRSSLDAGWGLLLRAAYFQAGGNEIEVDERWPASPDLGGLVASARNGVASGRRDVAFLEWRFQRSPVFRYTTVFARRGGRLIGCVMARRATFFGHNAYFIVDAIGTREMQSRGWRAVMRYILRAEMSTSKSADMVAILANLCVGPARRIARLPFVRIPGALLPFRPQLLAKWWSGPKFIISAETLPFNLGDCDVV